MAKSYDRNSYVNSKGRRSAQGASRGTRPTVRPARSFDPSNPRYHRGSSSADSPRRRTVNPRGANAPVQRVSAHSGNPYSRDAHSQDYSKRRRGKKRRRILMTVFIVVLVLVLGGAGAAFAFISSINSGFSEGIDDQFRSILEPSQAGDPFYMVLLGTDKSQQREESNALDGSYRTDSIMLLHVDPQNKNVTAISLMRDTMVDMGSNGTQKLNAAYTIGGAAYTVEVVSEMAGVPISHYAEIDFDGFKDVVDALGGIEVNVPVEIDDDKAGGHLDAGKQTLNGDQALILCRSRHTYDNIGTGRGDEYRAANQRMVIGAIAKKVLASDPVTMLSTVESLAGYITTDMSVQDILSLANSMRGMDMDTDFYTAVNPTTSEYIDDVWWEVMDEAAWQEMISRVDQGLPPTEEDQVDEATGIVMSSSGGGAVEEQANSEPRVHRTGTVSIRNGTDITGAAAAAEGVISQMGYTVDTGNANGTDYPETVVVYEDDDQQEYAQEIVDALQCGRAVKNNNEYLFETDFLVVIGSDWKTSSE